MDVIKRSPSKTSLSYVSSAGRENRVKRSAPRGRRELIVEAAHQEARDRVLATLGAGVEIPEREVKRWLRKLGAARR